MPTRLWVTPVNDLEALTIRDLLAEHDEPLLVTQQPWGATWQGLETGIHQRIAQFHHEHPHAPIYGIELGGPAPAGAVNIDHHHYKDEDRSHPLSSLEQVAQILGLQLTRHQQLVAANDTGWIPALEKAGASPEQIEAIRRADRAAQGITPAQEQLAEYETAQAQIQNGLAIVDCSSKPLSAHTDRLYGKAQQILLRHPSQWSYSGPYHQLLAALKLPEVHWSGGQPTSGFFGIQNPSAASQEKILSLISIPVENLETILYLPLRLDSCGELCRERDNPDTSPNQWLRQCSAWLQSASQGLWQEDTTPLPSLDERAHEYARFVYFHPFVHDLFPLRGPQASSNPGPAEKLHPSLTLIRRDLSQLQMLLSQHHSSPGIDPRNPAASLAAHPETITLQVRRIDLTLFLTDVAILRVHLENTAPLSLHTAMSLLNEVRRIYPPYWAGWDDHSPNAGSEQYRPSGQTPLFARWLPAPPETTSNATDRNFFIDRSAGRQSPLLMPHWRHLVYPIQPDDPAKPSPEGLTFNLLGDDRCFLAASLRLHNYAAISDAEWMRLAFVDEGKGSWAYNQAFLDTAETRQLHFYERFHDQKTRYLVTDYSFLQVMQKDWFPDNILIHHFRHHYNTLCLLALIQRSSIYTLSHRLSELLAAYANADRRFRDHYHRRCRKLASDLSTYVALYEFAEVSSQLQAYELFKLLRDRMRIADLFHELKLQVEFTISDESKNYEEYIQTALRIYIPASLAAGILGFSYGFDKYSDLYFKGQVSTAPADVLSTIFFFVLPMVLAFGFAWILYAWGKSRIRP
jgi:hypothetical protein